MVRSGGVSSADLYLLLALFSWAFSAAQSATTQISTTSTTQSSSASTLENLSSDEKLHRELETLLKELRQVAHAIDTVRKEHNRLSKGVKEISSAVKNVNEQSQHIKKKVRKMSKALGKGNHHHKLKDSLKELQKDHEHIIRAVTSLTLHHRSLFGRKKLKNIDPENSTALNEIDNELSMETRNDIHLVIEPPVEEVKEEQHMPQNCLEVMQMGNYTSGIYNIKAKGMKKSIKVWCDHMTSGGGWTLFLARRPQSSQQDFNQKWEDYKKGFGEPDMEHWLGNEALHLMTVGSRNEVRINITDWNNTYAWANWKEFSIASEEDGFAISVDRYTSDSTAGDALKWHNQMKFSTPDRDNDALMGGHCASSNLGGWWYRGHRGCYQAHPTGMYQMNPIQPKKTKPEGKPNFDLGPVLAWQNWRGESYFPKTLFLMFRPIQ